MKLTIQKEQVIEGLQKASGLTPSKSGAAYLRSIWIRAQGGSVSFMATDANIEFIGTYPAETAEPGMAGVQGRGFVDLIRQLPNGEIRLSTDKNNANLVIEQGRRRYRLALSNSDWFQEFSAFPEQNPIAWTGGVFAEYLDRVTFCISDEDLQDSLGCLCLMPRDNGRIDMCGLNGHQFAIVSFIYDDLCARLPKKGLLIQKKYLADVKKWLGPDEIELNLTDKRLYLRRMDGAEALSLPHAQYDYPDYNIFMSKLDEPDISRLEITRKEAIDALGRIQIFNTEADRCVFLEMSADEVNFSAQGSDLGSGRESLEADYKGDLDKIAFPTKNLMDIFAHFTSEQVTLKLSGAEGPAGISGADDVSYSVIIMPMKVAGDAYYDEEEEEA